MATPRQCPFVNRPDARCGRKLRIDHLDHAFEFCFDAYNTCPVFVERMLERRVMRLNDAAAVVMRNVSSSHGSTFVQLRTPAARRAAAAA
jgi:hypothetical protein